MPLNGVAAEDIEYKCLTINGYETPWTVGGEQCGTSQMATPLVAFAIRMRARNGRPVLYDCKYSGCFQSGTVVGPVANGTPCRSSVAGDPLEGIQVHFIAREPGASDLSSAAGRKATTGPRFSKLREEGAQPRVDVAAAMRGEGSDEGVISPDPALDVPTKMTRERAWAEDAIGGNGGEVPHETVEASADPLSNAKLMEQIMPFLSR